MIQVAGIQAPDGDVILLILENIWIPVLRINQYRFFVVVHEDLKKEQSAGNPGTVV